MSARLKRNLDLLRVLRKSTPPQRKAILKNYGKDLILCICEIIDNLLQGTVRLSPAQKKTLSKHKSILRQLANKKRAVTEKKKILVQKGGFLPAVLAPVLSVAATLLGEVLRK